MPETELVIFDCDGVLIDSEVISANMLIAELKLYGVEMDLDFVSRHFLGRSYPVVLKEVREQFGVALPDHFEADYRRRLLAAFAEGLRVMPGAPELLSRLARPYALATSSSPERTARALALTGLDHAFGDRVFTASQVARGKPAPDLFLHVAEVMGVAPAACLVVEDSLNGVRAGLAAGMEVWRFTGGSHLAGRLSQEPADATPHRHLSDFGDFLTLRPDLAQPLPDRRPAAVAP
ncbi:HAD family hydrolase [Solirhodobacter olei]|uniref:HAD family hydrolase n=1 Tax=Solirhodobacter olei TaxID=2493082 RepID=UPI000FDA0F2C|nr:HAD family hydrolase [Solirhodobacter olei]